MSPFYSTQQRFHCRHQQQSDSQQRSRLRIHYVRVTYHGFVIKQSKNCRLQKAACFVSGLMIVTRNLYLPICQRKLSVHCVNLWLESSFAYVFKSERICTQLEGNKTVVEYLHFKLIIKQDWQVNKMACFQDLETILHQNGKSVPETLAMLGTPFISMAIMEDGQISTSVIGSWKYNSKTMFQACSIFKPITALAVIKLAQQDRLNIDTSIAVYLTPTQLSWVSTPKTKYLVKSITVVS